MQTVNGRYHSAKRNLVGNIPGRPAPAWRASNMPNGVAGSSRQTSGSGRGPVGNTASAPSDKGGKIFISNFPQDVKEDEISDLMKKTVGPVRDAFVVYNNQGLSKGMAVISFYRHSDAILARDKYDQKVVDKRKPLKIELIVDSDAFTPPEPPKAREKTLFERIGAPKTNIKKPLPSAPAQMFANATTKRPPPAQGQNRRIRQKKGPRRVKKSLEQLDKEMEDYRSAAEAVFTG